MTWLGRTSTHRRALLLVVVPWLAGAAVSGSQSEPRTDASPYRRGVQETLDFRGPGRDEPEPDVKEVVLAWFGPGDAEHPAFGSLWRGATLAVEEENAAGGYRGVAASPDDGSTGKPFRLEPAWSENPWQAGIATLLRLVYERHALAVIGGVDGTTTHLALQVALKSHVLLLTPASTDVTTDRANVPWLFSLAPSDEALAAVIVPALSKEAWAGPFAVAATADHDGHAALAAFRRELAREWLTPAAVIEFPASGSDLPAATARVLSSSPRAVLVLGPAQSTGAFLAALRGAGFTGPVFGSATAAGGSFRSAAGDTADAIVAPCPASRSDAWTAFATAYVARWRDVPDEWAANGYDAVKLTVAAIRRAGLNRVRIRDAVRALSPWTGVAGTVRWDELGRNQRTIAVGSCGKALVTPLSLQQDR